jgi:hypothetical protein
MKGRQRRSASHVDDRGCVDADAAEALAGTNVIEAADLTQNAVNDVVDTLADTTVFPTVFTDRTPAGQFKQFIAIPKGDSVTCGKAAYGPKAQASTSRCMNE